MKEIKQSLDPSSQYQKDDSPSLVKREYIVPFILITSLFFLWGFARSILDVLNKHFQESFSLTKLESSWIQVMVYSAYFLVAIPAGLYINKKGYRSGVVFGLLLFGIGACLFIPSEWLMSYPCFLISLFILGCGLVFLETAANPYATSLGDPRTGASRLNLAQSFNGLGCVLGPMIGGLFLFTDQGEGSVVVPYTIMAVVVFFSAFIFTRVKLPEIKTESGDDTPQEGASIMGLWKRNKFVVGLLALLCYEIAEISINTFFINYVTDDNWLTPSQAAMLLSFGALLLFMIGRVIGSLVMSKVKAESALAFCGVATVICTALVMCNIGTVSRVALIACYAFEAIMFPTIFAIALTGLGSYTKRASSFLMMSPIGGAIGSVLMATVADLTNMSTAFVVPMCGYAVVMLFAFGVVFKKLR